MQHMKNENRFIYTVCPLFCFCLSSIMSQRNKRGRRKKGEPIYAFQHLKFRGKLKTSGFQYYTDDVTSKVVYLVIPDIDFYLATKRSERRTQFSGGHMFLPEGASFPHHASTDTCVSCRPLLVFTNSDTLLLARSVNHIIHVISAFNTGLS